MLLLTPQLCSQTPHSGMLAYDCLSPHAGTSCNQRLEHITGTEHAKILRVPFRSKAGILRKWISRCTQWLCNVAQKHYVFM